MKIDAWVLARDSNGAPDIVPVRLECTEQEVQEGLHYEQAQTRAAELGYEPMGVFDERDPAGTKLLRLMNFEGWRPQERVPGDPALPLWSVPLTVDMTLSATVLAHGVDREEALGQAREFAASPDGYGMFSLDEGNYRGPSDFYCGDPEAVEPVEPSSVDLPALQDGERSGAAAEEEPSGVVKTVIQVTVLHTQDQNMEALSLTQIGHEIDEGDFLGSYQTVECSPVPRSALVQEQLALGNDGSFFEYLTDEGDADEDSAPIGAVSRGEGA